MCSHPEGQSTQAPLNQDSRAWDGDSGLKQLQEDVEGRAGLLDSLGTLKTEEGPWPRVGSAETLLANSFRQES